MGFASSGVMRNVILALCACAATVFMAGSPKAAPRMGPSPPEPQVFRVAIPLGAGIPAPAPEQDDFQGC